MNGDNWVDSGLNRTAARVYADDHPPQQAHSQAGHTGRRRMTMNTEEAIATPATRQAWNAGRMVGAKRALKPKQIWGIRFFLNQHGRLRDRALFDLAIGRTIPPASFRSTQRCGRNSMTKSAE
jgi:hypothetical protein